MFGTNGVEKGQAGIPLIVTIVVAFIVASVMVPVAINEIESDDTTTLTQSVGNDAEIDGQLNSTVTSVTSGTPDTATVKLNDTRTTGTTSKTIDNQTTSSYDLEGGTVTVGVEDVNSGSSEATVNYTYANDYSFSSGASSLWGILGLVIVLGVFLYGIGLATDQF